VQSVQAGFFADAQANARKKPARRLYLFFSISPTIKNNTMKYIKPFENIMETLVIDWVKTNYSELPEMKNTYFYAFTRANHLVYIGITKSTSEQTVKQEITNTIKRLNISTTGLSIFLGYMNRQTNHLGLRKRIDDSLILNAECLLIFKNQPIENEQCKQSYTGRWNFRVISNDFSHVYNKIWCDEKGKTHYSNS